MGKFGLLYIIFLCFFSPLISAQGVLVISQYYEGLSFDKWLELTNVGDATLDLTSPQLYLHLFNNLAADDPANSTPDNSYTLTGSLSAGQVLLFQHSSAVNPTYAAGTNITVCNFNDDDLVIISTSGNTTDEGVAWTSRSDVVGDGTSWGGNTSFSRNTSAINPSTTFNISNWTEFTNAQVDAASTGTNERMGEFTGYIPLPVELSSFSAVIVNEGIKLNWRTETEVSNYGFEVERTTPLPPPYQGGGGEAGGGWEMIGFVEGHGNSNSPKEYSFVDNNISTGVFSYRLKQIDNDGKFEYSKVIEIDLGTPLEYELSQNYPNPFNPSTTIKFSIPEKGNVKLMVYNILGEEIVTLINEVKDAGVHTINFSPAELKSGIYFYKLESGNFVDVKKMQLVK